MGPLNLQEFDPGEFEKSLTDVLSKTHFESVLSLWTALFEIAQQRPFPNRGKPSATAALASCVT